MRIDAANCAGLFVDYQERLIPALNEGEILVENSIILAKGLIAMEVPIILSEQYPKGLGTTIEKMASIEGFPKGIEKTTFSCMDTKEIVDAIEAAKKRQIILTGCEAHVCVLQTAIDLVEKGYDVFLVADCIASRKEMDKLFALERASEEKIFITTYEAILFEILRSAKAPAFKTISGLVK